MAASRYGLPSGVTFTPVPVKMETAVAWCRLLETSQVFEVRAGDG